MRYLLSTYNRDCYEEDVSPTYNHDYYEEDISLTDLDYDVSTTILTFSAKDEFLVKIIPCTTKDELDRLEKMYIEQYDAFNSGYNSTGGNK